MDLLMLLMSHDFDPQNTNMNGDLVQVRPIDRSVKTESRHVNFAIDSEPATYFRSIIVKAAPDFTISSRILPMMKVLPLSIGISLYQENEFVNKTKEWEMFYTKKKRFNLSFFYTQLIVLFPR